MIRQIKDVAAWYKPSPLLFAQTIGGLIICLYLFRSVILSGPIMASDEYAFSILARFRQTDLFTLDPYLQRISNHLFFAWQNLWLELGGDQGMIVFRLVHILELLLSVLLLHLTFKENLSSRGSVLAAIATLLLPSTFYNLTLMPETELVLLGVLVGFVLVRGMETRPNLSLLASGVLSGLALLIKPHAVAWLPAVGAFIIITLWRDEPSRKSPGWILTKAITVFAVGWYLGFLIGGSAGAGRLLFNPKEALGLGIYGSYLNRSTTGILSLTKIASFLTYSTAHLIVLSLIFPLAIVALIRRLIALFRPVSNTLASSSSRKATRATTFILCMAVSHIAMVSVFALSVLGDIHENWRLHGRYLGCILIFLPFLSVCELHRYQDKINFRLLGVGMLVTSIIFGVWVINSFHLYPWDYPELFAFYSSNNRFEWRYTNETISTGAKALALCIIFPLGQIFRPSWGRFLIPLQLLILLILGQVQTMRWLTAHLAAHMTEVKGAQAIRQLVGPSSPGDGVVIGEQRYGRMSHILSALSNAPRVLVRRSGESLTAQDVLGAKWVLLTDSYHVDFKDANIMQIDGLNLVLFPGSAPSIKSPP